MPPQTISGGGINFSGCRPSVLCQLTAIWRHVIAVLSGGISIKLATNIHRLRLDIGERFSKSPVMSDQYWRRNTFRHHLFRLSFHWLSIFIEFTKSANENTDALSKHRLSPYNAHYLYGNFLFSFRFQYLINMTFTIIQSRAIDRTLW